MCDLDFPEFCSSYGTAESIRLLPRMASRLLWDGLLWSPGRMALCILSSFRSPMSSSLSLYTWSPLGTVKTPSTFQLQKDQRQEPETHVQVQWNVFKDGCLVWHDIHLVSANSTETRAWVGIGWKGLLLAYLWVKLQLVLDLDPCLVQPRLIYGTIYPSWCLFSLFGFCLSLLSC